MKAFRFRLARLLAVRRAEESAALGANKAAEAVLRALDAACDQVRREREELQREIRPALSSEGGPRRALYVLDHDARLATGLGKTEAEREGARKRAADAAQELRRRSGARKAIEELETRAHGAWNEELKREETALMDEAASRIRATDG